MRSKLESNNQQQKTKFLPMLCSSLSTKEGKPPLHRRCPSSTSSSEEPSSPRVGCMGQVKRNSSKVVGFPSMINFSASGCNINNDTTQKNDHQCYHSGRSSKVVKYHKLRSFFFSSSPNATGTRTQKCKSVKNSTTNIAVSTRCTVRTCRSLPTNENRNTDSSCMRRVVNLEELDPPLPVVVKKREEGSCDGSERSNLWKRRSGGTPLKTLQLQPLNQNRMMLCSASTV